MLNISMNSSIINAVKDISGMKLKPKDTYSQSFQRFRRILDKHEIRQYTKSEKGMTGNSFEYSICYDRFAERVRSFIFFEVNLLNPSPVRCKVSETNNALYVERKTKHNKSKNR